MNILNMSALLFGAVLFTGIGATALGAEWGNVEVL